MRCLKLSERIRGIYICEAGAYSFNLELEREVNCSSRGR